MECKQDQIPSVGTLPLLYKQDKRTFCWSFFSVDNNFTGLFRTTFTTITTVTTIPTVTNATIVISFTSVTSVKTVASVTL